MRASNNERIRHRGLGPEVLLVYHSGVFLPAGLALSMTPPGREVAAGGKPHSKRVSDGCHKKVGSKCEMLDRQHWHPSGYIAKESAQIFPHFRLFPPRTRRCGYQGQRMTTLAITCHLLSSRTPQ